MRRTSSLWGSSYFAKPRRTAKEEEGMGLLSIHFVLIMGIRY